MAKDDTDVFQCGKSEKSGLIPQLATSYLLWNNNTGKGLRV